ncbi:hypothetical protein IWW37_005526 [Coemansia sp. RSA 2050]|nr:hypothetical protein IWW37_005526 [Coemansia sp. RSA 2050]KAJ2729731.1 hypothetical protein IW152_005511 [Coemansia sp. BCRC 34962]
MSYIPRPPTGRADELWAQPNASAISKAASQSRATARPSSHRLPSSTRTSVVRVITGDAPLPNLPPIPGSDIAVAAAAATASFASTTRLSLSPSLHRHTASIGDELKGAPELAAPASTHSVDSPAATRLRMGVGSLKLGWAGGKAKHANEQHAEPMSLPWSADEVKALANASVRYWKSGNPVDFASLSADLGRPPGEVSDMLEYLLMGYARFGPTSCWAGESNRLVADWASIQFPTNPQLNPAPAASTRLASGVSRLDACLSALKCRPRLGARMASYVMADHGSATSGQNIVTDFRIGLRQHNPESSPPLPSTPGLPAANQTNPQSKSLQSKPSGESASAPSQGPHLPLPSLGSELHASGHQDHRTHRRTKSTASISPALLPAAEFNFTHPATGTAVGTSATQPVFTGGLRNRTGLNTLSRPSRARKLQQTSFRRQSFTGADTVSAGDKSQLIPGSAAAAATATVPPTIPPVLTSTHNALKLPEFGLEVAARPRASTFAVHSLSSNGTHHTLARDSGHVESTSLAMPPSTALDDIELHSSQSSYPAIGINQTDGGLDALFGDLLQETRQKIRRFVDNFIKDFPADFKQRVELQRVGKGGLCMTVDNFGDFAYNDEAYLKAIETTYRYVGGSMMYTCNIFFHVQLLHAVRLDRIPVTDDNWLRANEFATSVFNKRIEDARFIVFQEYVDKESATMGDDKGGMWPPSARRGHYGGIIGSTADGDSNEHNSPFQNAYYMDKQAWRHVRFLLENNSEEFMQRARAHGPRPMPVALQVDEETMLPFDLEVRRALIGFIWEDIPHSRVEYKEIALLRALELLNGELADRCGFHKNNLHLLLDEEKNKDESIKDDVVVAEMSELSKVPLARMAETLGTSFAQQFFAEGQLIFLEAMLHDHPFRPITRDELKDWMARGASPFGNDVDYQLNSKLYRYLKSLRVRPSSKQWLGTSAAATLSMLRRTLYATRQKQYLSHIDIEVIAARFREIELDAQGVSVGTAELRGSAPPMSKSARKLSMTAFGKAPSWVLHVSDTQLNNTAASDNRLGTNLPVESAVNGLAACELVSNQYIQAGPVGRTLPMTNGHTRDQSSMTTHLPSPISKYGAPTTSTSEGPRQEQSTISRTTLAEPPSSNASNNIRHVSTSATQPLSLPVVVAAGPDSAAHLGEANMATVLLMFEEMQAMIRQLQAQKLQ